MQGATIAATDVRVVVDGALEVAEVLEPDHGIQETNHNWSELKEGNTSSNPRERGV